MDKKTKIDWEGFSRKAQQAATSAANKTDTQLTVQLAAVTRLTQDEIQELFPDPADMAAFAELMEIVNASTEKHNKINQIVENSEKFAGIIIPLLSKVI